MIDQATSTSALLASNLIDMNCAAMTDLNQNATLPLVDPNTTVLDVASYILARTGRISAWKLQKLVYYSQAWSLVWDEKPLFLEPIQAWANGPVCPALYQTHRGLFQVDSIRGGRPEQLSAPARETVDAVLEYYGKWTSQQLRDLTHLERPWRDARGSTPPGEPGYAVIELLDIQGYYESIPAPAP